MPRLVLYGQRTPERIKVSSAASGIWRMKPLTQLYGAEGEPESSLMVKRSLLSPAYSTQQIANCRVLPRHEIVWALSFALDKEGRSIAARMAMIAMTTSNSISVKAIAASRCGADI